MQTSFIQLVDISAAFQMRFDKGLQFRNSLESVRWGLELIDFPNDLGSLLSFGKIDQSTRLVDVVWIAIFNEGQILEINTQERDARRIDRMDHFTIFLKIAVCSHQPSDVTKGLSRAVANKLKECCM